MKKINIIISIILLAAIFSSCTTGDSVKVTDDSGEKVDYVIYYNGSLMEEGGDSTANVPFVYNNELDCTFSSKTKVSKPEDAEDLYTLELNEQVYPLDYNKTYETAIANSERFQKYGKANVYKTEDIYLHLRTITNELLLFMNLDSECDEAKGDLTEEEANAMAESILLSVYGEELMNEYEYAFTIYTDTQNTVQYNVIYQRCVWGIPTNDSISIGFNMRGEVVGINSLLLGLYSSAEKDLQKSEIDNAIAVLNDRLSDTYDIFDIKLVLDSKGEYYISALITSKTPEEYTAPASTVYINVQ